MTTDHQLKQDVTAELAWEPSIKADHIGVTAEDGVVTLSGHVETFWQKKAAETAAGRVKGLKALVEEIEVRVPMHFKRGDDEIAKAAIDRMGWDVSIPKDAVKVRVEKGFVTLTGSVESAYQKSGAASDVRALMGVMGVANQITIKPRVDGPAVADDIRHALHRSWLYDNNIKVTVEGGTVRLTGTVESWSGRELAADTAWSAKGTTDVTNDIVIA